MKWKVVLAITGIVWLSANESVAQSYSEQALLISRIGTGGSARIQGMSGVQNALGGDLSSAFYNPAGLGMYNRSEFTITPAFNLANSSSTYLSNAQSESLSNPMLPNLGIAFHSGKDGSKGLWGGTFAINFNRINNFNTSFSYQGRNPDNSIIDYFINDANGTGTSQFSQTGFNYDTPTGLSYFNFLIGPQSILNPPGPNDQYFTDISGVPTQTETVKNTGAMNQWSFSYGANFNDKFFIGGGIGLTTLRYKSQKTFVETFEDGPMSRLQLDETVSFNGSGINATLGAIVRPIDFFQFGLSIATPTGYQITDNYVAAMSTAWKNFEYTPGRFLNNESASTDNVTSSYGLSTPWRLSGGATFFIQKKGFISVDIERFNYGSTKYNSTTTGVSYSEDNNEIRGLYRSVFNIRAGGEYRYDKFRFRAGYSMMPDPFQVEQNGVSRAWTTYTAGLGYRTTKFYIDLAAVLGQGNTSYRPYRVPTPTSPLVTQDNKSTTILVTLGFPF